VSGASATSAHAFAADFGGSWYVPRVVDDVGFGLRYVEAVAFAVGVFDSR
jgi:hypothetical protein